MDITDISKAIEGTTVSELIKKLKKFDKHALVKMPQCDLQEGKFYNLIEIEEREKNGENIVILWAE